MTEEIVDIREQLEALLVKLQPELQDVMKRSFTNVAVQQTKNGEKLSPDLLEDTSYFAKNTQVNMSRLELIKGPSFHIQNLNLDLNSMQLSVRCSLGDVCVRGLYCAFNENLYNLIPVMSEGHVVITIANMVADINIGLVIDEDSLSFINPCVDFQHDEVLVKLSWPSPQKNGGYDFTSTELLAKHIDDLPLTSAIALPLYTLLQNKLVVHLEQVLKRSTSVSEMMCCNPCLMETFRSRIEELASNGNKLIDMVLINMRRTLLQNLNECVDIPPLHATFLHKIGSISFVGKLESDTGWVKNLATVNRISDVTNTQPDPNKTTFRAVLKIKDLQMSYDQYHLKAMGLSSNGRIMSTFNVNSIHLSITVGLAQWEPYAQLDDLSVRSLENTDLHITGLGPLSSLTPMVSAWCRGASVAHVSVAIATTLQNHLHIALRELPLWDILHQKNT